MKIAEIKIIPTYKKTCVAQSPKCLASSKVDSVSFGKSYETADSLETLTFYDNQKPVNKKTITIKSSAKFGDVTADESLWVERHLTADNVTSPKITVRMDAKIAGTLNSQDLYVGGELTANSLETQEACVMKRTIIKDTAKADELKVWGDLKTKNLIAGKAMIGGKGIITGDAQVENLVSKGSVLDIFGNTNVGRITTYNGNVVLRDVSRLDSVVFANDPDYFLEESQKLLKFGSYKIPEKVAIILAKGKQLFIDLNYPEDINKFKFFEYNPSEKDGFKGKPLSESAIMKRIQIRGQEIPGWFKRLCAMF